MIHNMFEKHGKKLDTSILLIEQATSVFKSKNQFYNPKLFVNAVETINIALEIASAPYFPTQIKFAGFQNDLMELNYESIKYYVSDKEFMKILNSKRK